MKCELLACTLAVASLAAEANAADWVVVATSDDGDRYSLDADSIIRDRGTVSAVIRNDYAAPRRDDGTGKSIFASLDRMVVDCQSSSFALKSRAYVAADGSEYTVVVAGREELVLRPAASGTLSESIVVAVCRAANPTR